MSDVPPPPEAPFLRNIGLVVTYRCQVGCPHCIVDAGPQRTEAITVDDATSWISQIASYRGGQCRIVSLTGGEPFSDIERLAEFAGIISRAGLVVAVVTNGYWATSCKRAVDVLRSIPGLGMISVSTDVYHQLAIPFKRVKNAILAFQELGIPYTVAVCTEDRQDKRYLEIVEELLAVTERRTIQTAITFRVGRAKSVGSSAYETSQVVPQSACTAAASPIIFPDGRVIACIGPVVTLKSPHPLLLGNLREEELCSILDRAETNAILHALRVWGPKKLVAEVVEAGYGSTLPGEYVVDCPCDACFPLFFNAQTRDFLLGLAKEEEFSLKTAYGRAFYLKEPTMLEKLAQNG